jgi:hypothetical protein
METHSAQALSLELSTLSKIPIWLYDFLLRRRKQPKRNHGAEEQNIFSEGEKEQEDFMNRRNQRSK